MILFINTPIAVITVHYTKYRERYIAAAEGTEIPSIDETIFFTQFVLIIIFSGLLAHYDSARLLLETQKVKTQQGQLSHMFMNNEEGTLVIGYKTTDLGEKIPFS